MRTASGLFLSLGACLASLTLGEKQDSVGRREGREGRREGREGEEGGQGGGEIEDDDPSPTTSTY